MRALIQITPYTPTHVKIPVKIDAAFSLVRIITLTAQHKSYIL